MIMSGKHDHSPEAIEDRRHDRNGWLFAVLVIAVCCTAILGGLSTVHPWP